MPRLRRRALAAKWVDPLDALLEGLTGAERVIRFIEGALVHGKGEWAGKPFLLMDFQKDIIRDLFSTDEAGRRRYREALLMLPRKSGKTTIAAGLAAYFTFCGEPGGQIACSANSRDQANLLFSAAADAIEGSQILAGRAKVSRATKTITDRVSRSSFRAISADAGTNHGLDLVAWIFDELHEAPNDELLNTLRTSTGSRREPLGIVISTAGSNMLTPLGALYEHAKRVEADPDLDPTFYSRIYEADRDDDWTAESTWRKANPALGVFRSLEEMRAACTRAKSIPSQELSFKRLYLNQWTASETRWLSMDAWDRCAEPFDMDALRGKGCYGGLDLSATTDLTAFVLAWPVGDEVFVRPWFFIPAEGMTEREKRDRVPYSRWVQAGLIEATPGAYVDHRHVSRRILELAREFNLQYVAFDRWGALGVMSDLSDAGLTVVPFGQGYASMSGPTKRLQEITLAGQLRHGGNPVLRWNADCMTVAVDGAGNIKPVKVDRKKSTRRIDGMVALVMGLDLIERFRPVEWREPIVA